MPAKNFLYLEGEQMFVVFLSPKKKYAFLLVIILIAGALFFRNSYWGYFKKQAYGVKPGVVIGEEGLEGLTQEEVEAAVTAVFGGWHVEPVDAQFDPQFDIIIPELWGYEVDIPATVAKIMSAAKNEEVEPVLKPLRPEITMQDYPGAFIEKGNPQKKKVALMVNVAWGTEHILPMLEIFDAGDAQATFFVVGKWAQKNEDLLQEISRRGHLLANHGFSDAVVFTEISVAEMEHSLREVNEIVQAATGQVPCYFTPHKGAYNELVLETVARQEMRMLMWSIDTVDWMKPGVQKMKERVLGNLHPGAIILAHPTADTVDLFAEIVPIINDKGFKLVTMAELLNPDEPPAVLK
jgi:probable sporulation protein (polysaccharide deacetylase family)